MKKEDLTALGLTEEQAESVITLAGKELEAANKEIAKVQKKVTTLEAERDDLSARLETANGALSKLEGVDPEALQAEVQKYKDQAAAAEKNFNQKMTRRDQEDWLKGKLDEYGVNSPYARKQLMSEVMGEENGLKWKDGNFLGFDDYMKLAKEKDGSLYQTAEEKAAAEKAADQAKAAQNAPKFTSGLGEQGGGEKNPFAFHFNGVRPKPGT